MSNTFRHVSEGWTLGNPQFDDWNSRQENPVQSRKHQISYNKPVRAGKSGKFTKGLKNLRYNLLRKIDNLKLREELNG